MDIKLKARLSAYARIPSPRACVIDTVTNEEIDSLFQDIPEDLLPTDITMCSEDVVSEEDIDTLFRR